ncbi:MAG: hypothetical protein ABID63_05630 [Pseudomonadota bacterium]
MDDQAKDLKSDTNQDEELGTKVAGPNRLFQGVDAFRGKGKLEAVTGEQTTGESNTQSEYKMTTSISEFVLAANVSVELAAEDLFNTTSVSAKAQFVKQLEITDKSVVVLVYYKHEMKHTAFDTAPKEKVTLPPIPLDKTKLLNFFDNYGNKYVTQISKGGEYIAAYVFRSTSSEEQNKIVSELNGKGIYSGGKLEATTISSIESVRKESNVDVSFSQTLIGYSGISLPKDENDIFNFISTILTKQERPDETISYICNDYFEVPGLTREMFSPITDSYALFADQIVPCIEKIVALKFASNQLQNIYDSYGYTLDTQLTGNLEKTKTAETALRKTAKTIATDPTANLPVLPDTSIIAVGLPEINVIGPVSEAAIAGTSAGGNTIADFSRDKILSGVVFSASIVKSHYGCLIELDSTYGIWKNGMLTDKVDIVHAVGDPKIGWSSFPPIPEGYFVTQLKGYSSPSNGPGYWSNNAAAIEMWITGDDVKMPPSLTIGEVPDKVTGVIWNPKTDTNKGTYEVFVGWAGNCGDLINQLGPQVITFGPATWHPLD